MKYGFVLGGLILTLAYYDAPSNVNDCIPNLTAPVQQRSFASDQLRDICKLENCVVLVSAKN